MDAAGEEHSLWTELPRDCALIILRLLPHDARAALACTCTAWRAVAADDSLWADLSFEGQTRQLSGASLASLTQRAGARLRRLDVTSLPACAKLQSQDVERCFYNHDALFSSIRGQRRGDLQPEHLLEKDEERLYFPIITTPAASNLEVLVMATSAKGARAPRPLFGQRATRAHPHPFFGCAGHRTVPWPDDFNQSSVFFLNAALPRLKQFSTELRFEHQAPVPVNGRWEQGICPTSLPHDRSLRYGLNAVVYALRVLPPGEKHVYALPFSTWAAPGCVGGCLERKECCGDECELRGRWLPPLIDALAADTTVTEITFSRPVWMPIPPAFGSPGALWFAALLLKNSTLKKLSLTDHDIGDRGALALAEALLTNRTLESLDIGQGDLPLRALATVSSDEAVAALRRAMESRGPGEPPLNIKW